MAAVKVVFDGPPSHEFGRFVEVRTTTRPVAGAPRPANVADTEPPYLPTG